MIRWELTDDGIVVLTLDDPGKSMNTMNDRFLTALTSAVERLVAERDTITGVVVTSAKEGFLAGAHLTAAPATIVGAGQFPFGIGGYEAWERMKGLLRRLEKLGRPVVAALNGTALGAGFELALASHHRVAVNRPDARFGLPEVALGLLPGGGGTARVPRMIGIVDGLMKVLLQGQRLRATEIHEAKLVDELVSTLDELVPAALAWIRSDAATSTQPWDRSGYRLPGGWPGELSVAGILPSFPANLRTYLKRTNYPAPRAILRAVVEGAQVDFDTALRIESRWFGALVGSRVQRNLTQAFYFDLNHLNRGGSRPSGVPQTNATKVGVIGAGMMGAGIAYAFARAGLDVVLVDVAMASALRGKAYSSNRLDLAIRRGWSTAEKRDALLARITPTDDLSTLAGCDAVIEAIFEDLELKQETLAKVVGIVGEDCLLTSTTSTLPISSIFASPNFIGLHFLSPVDKMSLVEIVRGRQTSDRTLARGFDLVRAINKTPIVVNDSRGFFTSRICGTYVMEGIALLGEGVPAASVEQAALEVGYPVGPLAVADEITLTHGCQAGVETREGVVGVPTHPGKAVVDRMVNEFERYGKSTGKGFYDYPADEPKELWAGLAEAFSAAVPPTIPMRDMRERLLFAVVLESVKCLDEGVLTSAADGNIGSLFGIDFPAWTGGALQFIETYPGGVAAFVARAQAFAGAYGTRFNPPPSLFARSA